MALTLNINKKKQIRLYFDEEMLTDKLNSLINAHGELFVIDIIDYLLSLPVFLIHRTIKNKEYKDIEQIIIFASSEILIQQEYKLDDLPFSKSSSGK